MFILVYYSLAVMENIRSYPIISDPKVFSMTLPSLTGNKKNFKKYNFQTYLHPLVLVILHMYVNAVIEVFVT